MPAKKTTSQRNTTNASKNPTGPVELVAADGKQRQRKRELNTRLLSLAHTPDMLVRIVSPVKTQSMPSISRNEDGTVQVVDILDLTTGELGTLLCTRVLASILERLPEYVNHEFEIHAQAPQPGKNYRDVRVFEVG